MRCRLQQLNPVLERALRTRLEAAGHAVAGAGEEADALVVGVGAPTPGRPVLEISQAEWEDAVARARTAFAGLRDLCAELTARAAPGRVVVVIDPPALRVAEGGALAAVPGAFLTTIAQVGAAELAARGVAVNVLVAGWMAPAPAALADGTPLGRLVEPDEVARAAEFLLGEQASAVTGATLAADGGWWITKAPGGSPLLAGDA
jgi:3-oxoacyl-[acyl-carrier protein] reductase